MRRFRKQVLPEPFLRNGGQPGEAVQGGPGSCAGARGELQLPATCASQWSFIKPSQLRATIGHKHVETSPAPSPAGRRPVSLMPACPHQPTRRAVHRHAERCLTLLPPRSPLAGAHPASTPSVRGSGRSFATVRATATFGKRPSWFLASLTARALLLAAVAIGARRAPTRAAMPTNRLLGACSRKWQRCKCSAAAVGGRMSSQAE